MMSGNRDNNPHSVNNAKVTSDRTLARASGFSGRLQLKYAGAAAVVGAFFVLGAYTAGANSKDPEATFVQSFNSVLFVGVVGAAINSTSIENALTDNVSIGGAPVPNVASFEPADNLVAQAQKGEIGRAHV